MLRRVTAQPPEIRYARSGEVSIAYCVAGEGPIDIVVVPGWVSHLESALADPGWRTIIDRLAAFGRVAIFDKRGTGMSDRVPDHDLPTLEVRMDDVRAVMDAAGMAQAALFGISEGGPLCILFTATYPERTTAMVLFGTYARRLQAPDYPWGVPEALVDKSSAAIMQGWGGPVGIELLAPSIASDPAGRSRFATYLRAAASPGAALALDRMNWRIDVRHVLSVVRRPTLVMHRTGDRMVRVGNGRYLAENILDATLVELEGDDHLLSVGDTGRAMDAAEVFLTGTRHGGHSDRILATLLFADIAGSTELVAELGDARWRAMLESFYEAVARELGFFRGREVDRAGDGLLAAFDGPARAVRCAAGLRHVAAGLGLRLRCGVHTGECEQDGTMLRGIAVHTAARVAGAAAADEILVSSTVRDLVAGSGLEFSDRGNHQLKGVPGAWRLYAADLPR